jgi:hypothetical protein
MNKKYIIIGLVVLVLAIVSAVLLFSYKNSNTVQNAGVQSPIIVYKTKADYFNLVSGPYNSETGITGGNRVPKNFASEGELGAEVTYRYKLDNGYILDYGVFSINTVFLDFTYEEYDKITEEDIANPSRTDTTPLLAYLSNHITDKDPFLEFYDCSETRNYYKDLIFEEKTAFIDACLKNKQIDLNIYEYYEQQADYFKDYSPTDPKYKTSVSDLSKPISEQNVEVLDESQYPHRYLYLSAKYAADVGNCSTEFYDFKFPEKITYEEELFYYINEYIVKNGQLEQKCERIK